MTLAGKLWLPIGALIPAATARPRTMRHASDCPIGRSASAFAARRRPVLNNMPLRSAAMPAASTQAKLEGSHSQIVMWVRGAPNSPSQSGSESAIDRASDRL
jgi:hypothetical protein